MTRTSKKDWRNLPVQSWAVTTFREYLKDKHQDRYAIPYVTNNYAVEGRMMKNFIKEHGEYVTLCFIDACFSDYTPSSQYPGLNFGFMYSYMKGRVLPRVLAEIKREGERKEAPKQELAQEDFEEFI